MPTRTPISPSQNRRSRRLDSAVHCPRRNGSGSTVKSSRTQRPTAGRDASWSREWSRDKRSTAQFESSARNQHSTRLADRYYMNRQPGDTMKTSLYPSWLVAVQESEKQEDTKARRTKLNQYFSSSRLPVDHSSSRDVYFLAGIACTGSARDSWDRHFSAERS